jgi:SAM-dependent methyltransferase
MEIRSYIKRVTPKLFRYHLKNTYRDLKTIKARKVFEHANRTPMWLEEEMLEVLQNKYSYPPAFSYDYDSRKRGGEYRAKAMLNLLGKKNEKKVNSFLELGCYDGVIGLALLRRGKMPVGVDIRFEFHEKALKEGVFFSQMDASRLGFKNDSFDLVCSFASFEHFSDPESVLDEALRLTKPGGYIYLHFGPLYMSQYGLHAYRSITVPYCQFLFPPEVLTKSCLEKDLKPPDYTSLNKWTIEDYRNLWDKYSSKLRTLKYYEYINSEYLDIVIKYPSCFRSKNISFDNLIFREIEVLFQKNG